MESQTSAKLPRIASGWTRQYHGEIPYSVSSHFVLSYIVVGTIELVERIVQNCFWIGCQFRQCRPRTESPRFAISIVGKNGYPVALCVGGCRMFRIRSLLPPVRISPLSLDDMLVWFFVGHCLWIGTQRNGQYVFLTGIVEGSNDGPFYYSWHSLSIYFLPCSSCAICSPAYDADARPDFWKLQVTTTRNVTGGHGFPQAFVDWFCGGLQYQVDHHLFPTLPRHNLKKAHELIHSFCKEWNVQYHEADLVDGTIEVLKHLSTVSDQFVIDFVRDGPTM